MTAPVIPKDHAEPVYSARARLAIYFENNLLQSGVLTAHVVRKIDTPLNAANTLEIDYVLTSRFQELGELLGRRQLQNESELFGQSTPIALNLTLNDDGADGHRILIRGQFDPTGTFTAPVQTVPTAAIPYNPVGSAKMLATARQTLLDCFFERDPKRTPIADTNGIQADNSKSYEQFKLDLYALALQGAELFRIITRQAQTEDPGLDARDWTAKLRAALVAPGVLQIARAKRAEYAFPWALVYDIPMPGPEYHLCDVCKQWANGPRLGVKYLKTCPHAGAKNHQENVLCPFGFWGLKHIVEQPPSVPPPFNGTADLRDARRDIPGGPSPNLGLAFTSDPKLDQRRLQLHQAALAAIAPWRLHPPLPAHDVYQVRDMLPEATIAYFLCHGVNDKDGKPFLVVGPGNDFQHWIGDGTIHDWADTPVPPNLQGWRSRRPFICINGCHTADLKPEQLQNFVSAFIYAGASGVLGTEVNIRLPLAIEIGESLMQKLAAKVPAGVALYQMRWELANKGNLLGLAYTLFARSDLCLDYADIPAGVAMAAS